MFFFEKKQGIFLFFDFWKGHGRPPPSLISGFTTSYHVKPSFFNEIISPLCIWRVLFNVWFRHGLTVLITFKLFVKHLSRNYRYFHLLMIYQCITLEGVHYMIRTCSQLHRTDKYSKHSSIIWSVWPYGWVLVYKLSGSGFESSCNLLFLVLCMFAI